MASRRTVRTLALTLALLWVGYVLYVGLEQLVGRVTFREFGIDPLNRARFLTLFYWLPWVLLAPLVAAVSARFPIGPDRWRVPVAVHFVSMLGASVLHGLGAGFFYHYSSWLTPEMAGFEPWRHSGHFLFGDDMLLFDLVCYCVVAAALNIRNFQDIVRRQELDAVRLNQHLTELRFETLRMQVNPHFLFNALNAISVLVRKGQSERAAEMIGRLGRFFRQTLEGSSTQWVALEEELATVREYIAIAQLRFGERLSVREECEPSVRRVAVPAMLLQPLVENAVTHGLGNKVGRCELAVLCRSLDDGRVRVEIHDNGVGGRFFADPAFVEGVGLANVRARLAQMYGDEHLFRVDGEPGRGTRVVIELPRAKALRRAG